MNTDNQPCEEGIEDNRFYIEASSGSEAELGIQQLPYTKSQNDFLATGDTPLDLASPLSGQALRDVASPDSSPSPTSRRGLKPERDQALECDDQPLEEWMMLGGEEQDGDRDIRLNLGYWNSSSAQSRSETEDDELNTKNAVKHDWFIIEKDKPQPYRYFTSEKRLTCRNCNKTGHLAGNCTTSRRQPACVLCGLHGHVLRDCLSRHCSSCGLPSHGYQPCSVPAFWNQHCLRCGMIGHLLDACPDTWRQFHLTTQEAVPLRPHIDHTHTHHRRPAHCYNCAGNGHHGHECYQRRMFNGTFPVLPYVCYYDSKQDILNQNTRIHRELQEGVKPVLDSHRIFVAPGGICESGGPWRRTQDGRRKEKSWTWPEKRRKRRAVKKQRREARARIAVQATKYV
ncbi:hypothetical protein UPYG_G00217150 [Umbra pygmaea]|uniref:Zinc finger CCHC domain-containing protein 7 n=1 Tax=Umbra pygmaea TaxID=75934 RepID=A0ABD0X763_UMBPY